MGGEEGEEEEGEGEGGERDGMPSRYDPRGQRRRGLGVGSTSFILSSRASCPVDFLMGLSKLKS